MIACAQAMATALKRKTRCTGAPRDRSAAPRPAPTRVIDCATAKSVTTVSAPFGAPAAMACCAPFTVTMTPPPTTAPKVQSSSQHDGSRSISSVDSPRSAGFASTRSGSRAAAAAAASSGGSSTAVPTGAA